MTISLIIPVYNRLALLEKCLKSVIKQDRLPDEIILSDDGSDEDIVFLLNNTISQTKIPIKLVRQTHKGFRAARARNNGAMLAECDILVFIDQDIVISNGYISEIERVMRRDIFLSGYPIRLTAKQSNMLTNEAILSNGYRQYLNQIQIKKVRSQYRKDYFYYILCRYLKLKKRGAKLRSGVLAIFRDDFYAVNGFDEKYIGWGNEDDDLGRRLYAFGKVGFNFCLKEIPLHLHHEPFHFSAQRVNQEYSNTRKKLITKNNFSCENGVKQPRPDIEILYE